MADETVSILGIFQDQISPGMGKVASSAERISASVDGANQKLITFGGALTKIRDQIQTSFKPVNTTLPALTGNMGQLANQAEKTGQVIDAQFTTKTNQMSKSLDSSDKAAAKLAARGARLASALFGVQIVLQGLTGNAQSGGLNKFQTVSDAAAASLTTFATTVVLLPGPVGLALGAITGLAAGFKTVKDAVFGINQASADLLAKFGGSNSKIFSAVASEKVDRAFNTSSQNIQLDLDKTKEKLKQTQGQIQAYEAEIDKLNAKSDSQHGFLSQDELERLVKLEQEILPNTQSALSDLFESAGKLNGQLGDAKAIETYHDAMKGLSAQSAATKKALELGIGDELDLLQQQAQQAAQKLDLLVTNREAVVNSGEQTGGQIDDAIRLASIEKDIADSRVIQEEARRRDVELSKENIRLLEEQQDLVKGISDGWKQATKEVSTMRGVGLRLGQALGQGVLDFTDVLLDGLAKGNLSLAEFAGNFLLSIGKMIAQALVLRAIMAGLGVIGIGGGAEGDISGIITGFAGGGSVPGPDVNSDVVPAMLTPGEFVMRKDAVSLYGRGVMAALNRGLMPPAVLRGSAGSIHNVSGHFAEGGEVPFGAGAVPKPAMAFVVSSNTELERLLAGGKGAMMRFFERNRAKTRAAQGIGGR